MTAATLTSPGNKLAVLGSEVQLHTAFTQEIAQSSPPTMFSDGTIMVFAQNSADQTLPVTLSISDTTITPTTHSLDTTLTTLRGYCPVDTEMLLFSAENTGGSQFASSKFDNTGASNKQNHLPTLASNATNTIGTQIDTDKVLVFYKEGTTPKGVIYNYSSISNGGTITNTAVAIPSGANSAALQVIKLSTTTALLLYSETFTAYLSAVVVSISGSTISYNTSVNLDTTDGLTDTTGNNPHFYIGYLQYSGNVFDVFYRKTTGSFTHIYRTRLSVSGTTVTAGSTIKILDNTATTSYTGPSVAVANYNNSTEGILLTHDPDDSDKITGFILNAGIPVSQFSFYASVPGIGINLLAIDAYRYVAVFRHSSTNNLYAKVIKLV